jgi:hypothetical protein
MRGEVWRVLALFIVKMGLLKADREGICQLCGELHGLGGGAWPVGEGAGGHAGDCRDASGSADLWCVAWKQEDWVGAGRQWWGSLWAGV